jgi:antitoxin CptB
VTVLPSENRLRWLCRRGMLELDAWLSRFFETRYAQLSPQEKQAFAGLLDQDDMRLFDWFTGGQTPPDEFRSIVDHIRTFRIQP